MGMQAQFILEKPRFFLKSIVEILQTDSLELDFFTMCQARLHDFYRTQICRRDYILFY